MAGSVLRVNIPDVNRHEYTTRRNDPLQHILESIYRESDLKNLAEILGVFEFNQLTAQKITSINHNKGILHPRVVLIDIDNGMEFETYIEYNDVNNLTVYSNKSVRFTAFIY